MLPTKKDDLSVVSKMMFDVMPIQLPEMQFEADPISKFFQNLAIKQMSKYELRKAEIAEYRDRQNKAYIDTMTRMIMFGDVIQAKKETLKDIERRREYNLQISAETLKEMKLKNYLLTLEAKDIELNRKLKLKELDMEEDDA